MRLSIQILCTVTSLTVCGAILSPSAADEPVAPFDPMVFFDGHTLSRGVVEDRSGAPTEEITTESHASIDAANRLHMEQHLIFRDGKAQNRTWTVWRTGPHRFAANASDMVGTATGETHGRMFHWQWVLARSPGNPLMNVTMEQWMYGLDDGSAMIRTTIGKFGIILAEVTEHFSHPQSEVPPAPPGYGPRAVAPRA